MATTNGWYTGSLPSDQVSKIISGGPWGTTNYGGVNYGVVGSQAGPQDGGGFTPQMITGYQPGQMGAGAGRSQFGLDGSYTGMGQNGAPSWKDGLPALGAALGMAAFLPGGFLASGGAGGGLAADAVQGNSINALDAATGVPYGSEAGGWTLGGGAGAGAAADAATVGGTGSSLINGISNSKLLGAGIAGLGGLASSSRNGSAPTAPDPYATAQAQLNANIQAANYSAGLNRVNQTGPYGSLTYTRTPGQNGQPDTWTANYALDPAQQHQLDASNMLASKSGDTANLLADHSQAFLAAPVDPNVQGIQHSIDTSGVPGLVGGNQLAGDLNTQRNSLYQQQAAYLDPQWTNQQNDLENQLTQQGIMRNSDAWNRAMDDFGRQKTFAYQQAANNAITGGGQEQSRLFNIGLQSNQNAFNQALQQGNFTNAAQAQQANEIFNQYDTTLGALKSLTGMAQPTTPQFGNVPIASVGAPDIASLIKQNFANQMGGYNSQVASNNQLMGGLFGLGSALLAGGKG